MSKNVKKAEQVEYTGKYLVLLPEGANTADSISSINQDSGLNLKSSLDFENEFFTMKDLEDTDGIILDKLGIAILNEKPAVENSISSLGESSMIVEKERVVYAIHMLDDTTQKYVEGYRDAVNQFTEMLVGSPLNEEDYTSMEADIESVGSTWGLKATKVTPSTVLSYNPYTGAGIKVAILDTGFDFSHPDFSGRPIVQQSFVSGQASQDGHGHGTHCTGTACGPLSSVSASERYGIAYGSQIYIGKVLNNLGKGADGGILAGINWAIANGCSVVSMSLGAPTVNSGFSAVFETAAARALSLGTLIVAAAGNDSARAGMIRPVSHPANCPSIMAVGAVDINMNVAAFSNGGQFLTYGAVDIAGPGVNVYSSTKLPGKYAAWNGTSMATPHVAGIAALWAQATGLRGMNLWNKLIATAKALPQPKRDVGAGLVQAPTKLRLLRPFPFPKPILINPKFPIDPIGPIEK